MKHALKAAWEAAKDGHEDAGPTWMNFEEWYAYAGSKLPPAKQPSRFVKGAKHAASTIQGILQRQEDTGRPHAAELVECLKWFLSLPDEI